MTTSRNIRVILLMTVFICCNGIIAMAQGPGFPPAPTDTPIDGGAAFILVAAAGYGYKKIAEKRKRDLK